MLSIFMAQRSPWSLRDGQNRLDYSVSAWLISCYNNIGKYVSAMLLLWCEVCKATIYHSSTETMLVVMLRGTKSWFTQALDLHLNALKTFFGKVITLLDFL